MKDPANCNTGRDIARTIVNRFYLHDDEEAYSACIRRLWKKEALQDDICTAHELLKAAIPECTDKEYVTWTRFVAGLCCSDEVDEVAVKKWGDEIQFVFVALKAVVTRVKSSQRAMEALICIHTGKLDILLQDEGVDSLGTFIFSTSVAANDFPFLRWILRGTRFTVWDASEIQKFVCQYAGQERIPALLGIMALSDQHRSAEASETEASEAIVSENDTNDVSENEALDDDGEMERGRESENEDESEDSQDDGPGELDAFLDPDIELSALAQSPSRHICENDITRILGRYRITSGKKGLIGNALDPTSFMQYTNSLNRLPVAIFPHKAEEVLLWLTEHAKKPSSLHTRVNHICKFMECMRANESDNQGLAEEKRREREELFGGDETFAISYEIYRQDCLARNEQKKQDQLATPGAHLSERDAELWEHEDKLRAAYGKRVIETERTKNLCRDKIEFNAITREDISALQEQAILEVYMEQPPLRSMEFQTMEYDPLQIEKDTNYVDGDEMVINRDKTSFKYGTYRMTMTPRLKDTVHLLIQCRKARGFERGRLFQRHDEIPYTRSGFTQATYQAFSRLIGKRLGCRMLRKIVQTGKTQRGELQWPSQRRAFHEASRHSAAVAEAHYVIEPSGSGSKAALCDEKAAPEAQPEAQLEDEGQDADAASTTTSERNETRKRRRTPWGKDVEEWFSQHCSDRAFLVGDGHRDWALMARRMNAACDSQMEGIQLKNRYCNLEKKKKKMLSQQMARAV